MPLQTKEKRRFGPSAFSDQRPLNVRMWAYKVADSWGAVVRWLLSCASRHVSLPLGVISMVLLAVNLGWSDDGEVIVDAGDPSILIHAQELLENQQVDAALDLLLPVLQLEDMRPILTQRFRADDSTEEPSREYRLYWPMGNYLQARFLDWTAERPDVLQQYRRRSDPLKDAWEQQQSFRSLAEKVDGAERFRLNSGMREKTLQLGIQLWETGQVLDARRMWLALVPQAWRVVHDEASSKTMASVFELQPLSVPQGANDETTDQVVGKALAYLTLASIVEGESSRAVREFELLKSLDPKTRIRVQGTEIDAVQWLSEAIESLDQDSALIESPEPATGGEQFSGLSVQWQVSVRAGVSQEDAIWVKEYPSLQALFAQRSRVRPSWEGGQVLWSEGERVRMLWEDSGRPRFPAGADWDDDPSQRGTFWESSSSKGYRTDGRSIVGAAAFTSDMHRQFAIARVGDPRSIQRSELPRQRSEWVAFDLQREGSLLAGFPLVLNSSDWEFEGNPLCDGEHLFVLKRYSQPDSQQSRLVLVCYALEAIQTPGDWQPVWETPLCESASMSQGLYHEIAHPRLAWEGSDLLVMTNLGAVIRIDSVRGTIRWLLSYPRDIADREREIVPLHWMRSGKGVIRVGQTLWVLPADTSELLCLDAVSGELLWATEVQGSLDLVGVSGRWVVLSGAGLVWVDRRTGQVAQRWPSGNWPLKPQFRWSESSGGRAAIEGDWIYWTTATDLYVVQKDLVPRAVPGGQTWWEAEVQRQLSLSELGIPGGDLRVRYPRVWIVGAETIAGLRFTSPQ